MTSWVCFLFGGEEWEGDNSILAIWRSRKAKRTGAREEVGKEGKGMWAAGGKAGKRASTHEEPGEPGASWRRSEQ